MPDHVWLIRTERKLGGGKRKSIWVTQDFYDQEEPARESYKYYKRILQFGVRLYKCKLIDESLT